MKIALKNKITGLYFDGVNFSAERKDAKLFNDSKVIRERASSFWSNAEVEEVKANPKKVTAKSILRGKAILRVGDFVTATGGWFTKDIQEMLIRKGFFATPCTDSDIDEFRDAFKPVNWPIHILRIREDRTA